MQFKNTVGILIAVILWGLSFIFTKSSLEYLSPLMLVTFRVLIAMTLMFSIAKITGKLQPLTRRDVLIFGCLVIAEPIGYFLFETYGVLNVSPTLACIVIAVIPLFTPLLAYFANGERVSRMVWVGLGISMVGVLLVIFGDGLDEISGRLLGVLLLFGAVVTAMIYTVMVKRLSERFNSFSIVAWQNVFSAMILIPLLYLFDWDKLSALVWDLQWVWRVAVLGIFCSTLAFVLYADALRSIGVARTSIFINLMPSITAVASFFILDERLGLAKIIGIAITISGLYIGERK